MENEGETSERTQHTRYSTQSLETAKWGKGGEETIHYVLQNHRHLKSSVFFFLQIEGDRLRLLVSG